MKAWGTTNWYQEEDELKTQKERADAFAWIIESISFDKDLPEAKAGTSKISFTLDQHHTNLCPIQVDLEDIDSHFLEVDNNHESNEKPKPMGGQVESKQKSKYRENN